ncbi:MAG: TusE/DsrC/DsvC family sulfur relay protein [Porticoccaceae bacterium]|nr:TusE/DsrC/DsvC family sulfur relay protein [Porticoccaceae bacterium]MDG1474877.1 TusE/DsrC/DsvC family sulfur relay protein [Porticoccaceae bacterium]
MSTTSKYLDSLRPWSINDAHELAKQNSVRLDGKHIEILLVAREFFHDYGFSPSMRPLCKTITNRLGIEKGRSVYLNQLFPGSPAKQVAVYAGLPAPKNCL